MKYFLGMIPVLATLHSGAQKASITGSVPQGSTKQLTLYRPAISFRYGSLEENSVSVPLAKDNTFHLSPAITRAEIAQLELSDSVSKRDTSYPLFLLPGYDLTVVIDNNWNVVVTGKGAADNQPLVLEGSESLQSFYGDTIPDRPYTFLTRVREHNRGLLRRYIDSHPTLSKEYISTWTYEVEYSALAIFFGFTANNAYQVRDAYKRNKGIWDERLKEIYGPLSLSNEDAIPAPSYRKLVSNFLLRTKEAAWTLAWSDRATFLQTYYPEDTSSGWKAFSADFENDLSARIIEKSFTGTAKEYAYGILFESALHEADGSNLVRIYNEFKKQFPDSRYRKLFDGRIAIIARKQQLPLTDKMIFPENGSSMKSLAEVLATMKGKTILLDMWGTWCGPCRSEMNKHADAIKKHFAGKGLDYLYVANRDQEAGDKWKQLIAFFNLEGYHILANKELTKDIMDKIKGEGYPAYAIIDRDGNIELSKAGYPMDREALITQIEGVLARWSARPADTYHRPDVE